MIISVPKEVMEDEYRVGLTPDKVDVLVRSGHEVWVETGAGEGASFSDDLYAAVGARLVEGAAEAYSADIVAKVKEPQPREYEYFRPGLVLFCYLHLAANSELTDKLVSSGVTGVALETLTEADGSHPVLYPMSEIAGTIAPQIASRLLQRTEGGPGKLLGGVPGTPPSRIVIVGGGIVGRHAALVAARLGAEVTVLDVDLGKLRTIDSLSNGTVRTLVSTPQALTDSLGDADVAIGAVHIPGARAPAVISRTMVGEMGGGSIIMDVAIDQGGSVERITPTTHSHPTYVEDGIIHYAVRNIPAVVANTASISMSNASYGYLLRLANLGPGPSLTVDPAIASAVNTFDGHLTHPAVADSIQRSWVPLDEAISA